MSTLKNLPKINTQISQRKVFLDLPMFDSKTRTCRGYVSLKYVNEGSDLNPLDFPVHFLEIDLKIDDDKNYQLSRYSIVDNKENVVKYNLAGSHIVPLSKTCFEFHPAHGTPLTVFATSAKLRQAWVKTIENVISVANEREKLLKNLLKAEDIQALTENSEEGNVKETSFKLSQDLGGVYSKIDQMIGTCRQ